MKRLAILVVVVACVALASPAVAGEKHAKDCTHDPADCAAKMAQKIRQKPWLGVELEKADHGRLRITEVVPGSPAEAAGFRAGDVLVKFNGIAYADDTHDAIKKEWYAMKPGADATYLVDRGGKTKTLSATLGTVPDAVLAQWVGEHVLESHTDVQVATK